MTPVVLLVGASGFLGSHVRRALSASAGRRVVPLARTADPDTGVLGLDVARAPVDEVRSLLASVEPTVIVNCAGALVGSSADLVEANLLPVARLLDAIGEMDQRPRLVHIGSSAEYGSSPVGVPITEAAATAPVSPYGIVKLAATQLVASATARGLVDGIVLRVFNVVGPGMSPNLLPGALAQRIDEALAAGATAVETGPLDAVRDFIDIRDVARAVVAAATTAIATPTATPILNIASGSGHTARELAQALARHAGFHGTLRERSAGSARSGDVPWQVGDNSLARAVLGWSPEQSFEEMCRSAVAGGAAPAQA